MVWRPGGPIDFYRVSPHTTRDVLQVFVAEINEFRRYLVAHLFIGRAGETDPARFSDAFQSRRDVHAVAHQVAVPLDDDIAQMNSDPEFDTPVRCDIDVPHRNLALHLDRAAHGVHDAAELDQPTIAGGFDEATAIGDDHRIDDLLPERSKPRYRALLVRAREPAIAGHIGGKNRRQPAGNLGHRAPLRRLGPVKKVRMLSQAR